MTTKEDKPTKNTKIKSFQAEHEDIIVKTKLKDFDYLKSRAWAKLTNRYGPKISQDELLSLAQVVAYHLEIDLFREYKRRKKMLIKWYDDNLDVVWPFIENYVVVTDVNNNTINFTANESSSHPSSPGNDDS